MENIEFKINLVIWPIQYIPGKRVGEKRIADLSGNEFPLLIGKLAILMGWGAANLPTDTKEFPARSYFLTTLQKTIGHYTTGQLDRGIKRIFENKHGFDEKLYGQQIGIKWFVDMLSGIDRYKKIVGDGDGGMTDPDSKIYWLYNNLENNCNYYGIPYSKKNYTQLYEYERFRPKINELFNSTTNTKELKQ